jgi:hypothetical protein
MRPRVRRSEARVAGADPPATSTDTVIAALLGLDREAGTEGAAAARRHISEHLRTLGFQVEVQRFAFSTGTLNALPVFGAGLGWLTILAIPLLLMPGAPAWAALAVWLLGLAALIAVAAGMALGWAPARGERREDANLIVRRPAARVRRWIVAHVDTKAQRQSMAGRIVALGAGLFGAAFMAGLALARLVVVPSVWLVAAGAGVTLAASVLASRARLNGKTTGALDNGSGLTAALIAAATADARTGFIFTGAEEFGLVGARILVQQTPELVRDCDVINLDSLDDAGDVAIVSHDHRARALTDALLTGLSQSEWRVRRRRLPPGIMVDSMPLARAGARAVTVARVTWSSFKVIHTPADAASRLDFASAGAIGRLLGDL